jgi:Skp family chaperone for outer membrane proteins
MCGAVAFLGGCGWGESSGKTATHGGLAVIDLDAVAKRLGRDEAMAAALRDRQAELNKQLALMQEDLRKQIQDHKAMAGENATPDEAQQLKRVENELNQKFLQAQRAAQENMITLKQDLVTNFREEVRPIAKEVATAQGLSTVVSKNENVVLAFEADVDITEKVTERMKAAPTTASKAEKTAAAEAPKPRLTGN